MAYSESELGTIVSEAESQGGTFDDAGDLAQGILDLQEATVTTELIEVRLFGASATDTNGTPRAVIQIPAAASEAIKTAVASALDTYLAAVIPAAIASEL